MMHQKGFVVLTSVIILSVVLLLVAQALSTAGYFQGSGSVGFESKELSYTLAYSCLDRAYTKLWEDFDYTGNETLTIGEYSCAILPLTTTGDLSTIQSQATSSGSTTKLKMIVDQDFNITSFQEL